MPVYVLGSQAIFGRKDGYMSYTDPKTKKDYYDWRSARGPRA